MTIPLPPAVEQATGSMGQCLLWLMETQYGGPGVMNVPIIYRMRGHLDVPALSAAFTQVVDRHEGLRTTFSWTDTPDPMPAALSQHIHPAFPVMIGCRDMGAEPDPYESAYEEISSRLMQDIDVTVGPPFTIDLYHLSPDDHLLMINVHHIVTDAWSNMLICRDLGEFYNREVGGPKTDLEPVDWPFRRYIEWQRERLLGPRGASHDQFWHTALARMQYLEMRPAPERTAEKKPPTENVWFAIEGPQVDQLRELATQYRTTLFVVLLTLFYCVLHIASGEHDVAIGSVFANRPRRELGNTVGFFANLVVLGARLPEQPSFRDAVAAVRHTVLEALAHQEFPYLSTLADPTMPPTAWHASEIVFHMLAVPDNVSPPSGISFSGLQVEPHPIPDGMGSRFDLELLIVPQTGMLEGVYRYAGDRYEKEFIERLTRYYQQLARAVVGHPAAPLARLMAEAGHSGQGGLSGESPAAGDGEGGEVRK